MARFIKDRSKAHGLAPGSLVFIGKQKMDKPIIQLMEYDSSNLRETELSSLDEVKRSISEKSVSWINIYGVHDPDLISKIGEVFNLPPLLLEDILDTDQAPKYEGGGDFDAFFMKMLDYKDPEQKIYAEQLSIVLGKEFVLTLQEQTGDVFNPVRQRIRNSTGRVRFNDNDYLVYALMDTIADRYSATVETVGGKIEALEDKIFQSDDPNLSEEIYKLKTELNFLRKSIRPVKELLINLLRAEHTLIKDSNRMYLKDLNDLINQSTEAIELYNNLVSDQLNIYNTKVSNRMNEVMKVLTIFASIFIPLTFIAGIYGMNFEYLPELKYKFAYPAFWGVVILLGGGLLFYFKRKKWL